MLRKMLPSLSGGGTDCGLGPEKGREMTALILSHLCALQIQGCSWEWCPLYSSLLTLIKGYFLAQNYQSVLATPFSHLLHAPPGAYLDPALVGTQSTQPLAACFPTHVLSLLRLMH